MAFTARTPEYYDSSSSVSGTVSVPSGTQNGDILFALIAWKNAFGVDLNSPPAGWNLLGSSGTPGTQKFFLYYRIASSEPANYTWTHTYAPSYPGYLRIAMYAYTGGDFDGADPIDVVSNTAYTTSNTTVRAAGMSVTAASSPMAFFGAVLNSIATTFTKPADIGADAWTEDDDAGNAGGSRFHFTADSMIRSSSGATGDMDATASASLTTKHAFAVALNPAAAAGYTLAAGSGSFAETGTAATLKATRKLTVASGSFTETGTAAALKYAREIAAGSGAFIESGTAAGLRTTRLLSVASGSFVETGTAATLKYALKIAAESGSFIESGTAAGLRATRLLSVASGTFIETGSAVTLIYVPSGAHTLLAGAGAYTVSGSAVALRATRVLVPGNGTFLETGTAAGLLRGFKVGAGPGAYVLAGTAVDFLYNRLLAAGAGVYTLTMTPAGLVYVTPTDYVLDVDSGTFLISGGVVYFPRPGASRTTYIFQKRRDHFRT